MLYLTLRHYEYVIAIAEAGSLSGAALALNVSQPALSTALTRIEARLGQRLFLRGRGQGFSVTPQGQRVVEEARKLIASAARLEAAGSSPLPQTRIGLGVFDDLAPFVLAPALTLLRKNFPQLSLHPQVCGFEEMQDAMLSGRIDLAVTWDIGLDGRFARSQLARLRPHVFLAETDPLAERREIALRDLATRAVILADDGLSVRHMMGLFAGQGLVPSRVQRAASVEVMRALAAHGEGLGLSYSVPPGGQSYDGKPLVTRPLADETAVEQVVVAQLGPWQAEDPLTQLRDALLTLPLPGAV